MPHEGTVSASPAVASAHPSGVMSSWASSSIFSLPARPLLGCSHGLSSVLDYWQGDRPSQTVSRLDSGSSRGVTLGSLPSSISFHLKTCDIPTATSDVFEPVLTGRAQQSGHYPGGALASSTPLGSPSQICVSSDHQNEGKAPASRTSDLTTIRSNVAPASSLAPSNHLSFTSSSGGPLILDHEAPSSPCRSEMRQDDRYPRQRRVYLRPRDIPKLDYGLPRDFVPSFGRIGSVRQDADPGDFAFVIPLDCPTSTPVASRNRGLKGSSFEADCPWLSATPHSGERERVSAHREIAYPPDPIFDFFGI